MASRAPVVVVDGKEIREAIQRLKGADAKTKARLRRALKESAAVAVQGVKDEVTKPVPAKAALKGSLGRRRKASTRSRHSGLRQAIANATTVSLLSGSERSGGQIKVTTSQRRLPERYAGMAKAYNAETFRHPVFADAVNGDRDNRTRGFRALAAARKAAGRPALKSWKWVEQHGQRNYFGKGVFGRREEMLENLRAAIDAVMDELTG